MNLLILASSAFIVIAVIFRVEEILLERDIRKLRDEIIEYQYRAERRRK